jgi:hypothetical protein
MPNTSTDRAPTILSRIQPDQLSLEPFPFVSAPDCLDAALFRTLSSSMPVPKYGPDTPSNMLTLGSPFERPLDAALNDTWQAFAKAHVVRDFFEEAMALLGDAIRAVHPDLETRIGRRLEEADVSWRGAGADTDFQLDFQLSYNSPVREVSSVRGPHLDKTRRLVSALLYMPQPGDDAGGDLVVYRFKGARRFQGVAADLDDVEPVTVVPYEPNRLMLFVNGTDSVHGVLPRAVTDKVRRYVNLFIDYREPLFSLDAYQTAP